jgi:hypothetical protein
MNINITQGALYAEQVMSKELRARSKRTAKSDRLATTLNSEGRKNKATRGRPLASDTHQLGSRMVYKIAARSEWVREQAEREGATQREEEARARQA